MTDKQDHPALAALLFATTFDDDCLPHDLAKRARAAIPALEATLAERDELLAALEPVISSANFLAYQDEPCAQRLLAAIAKVKPKRQHDFNDRGQCRRIGCGAYHSDPSSTQPCVEDKV